MEVQTIKAMRGEEGKSKEIHSILGQYQSPQ